MAEGLSLTLFPGNLKVSLFSEVLHVAEGLRETLFPGTLRDVEFSDWLALTLILSAQLAKE